MIGVIDGGGDEAIDPIDSTESGLLNPPCVVESSGVSKNIKLNSECASKRTSVISSVPDAPSSTKLELIFESM